MRDIERADQQLQQGQLLGTSGVAYAGGAASNSSLHLLHTAVERIRVADRSSPKESDSSAKRQAREKEVQNPRESPKTRERSQTMSSTMSQHTDTQSLAQRTPEYRGSPPFHTPMASPGERTAAYTQYIPDSYTSSQATTQAQSSSRKPVPASSEPNAMRSTPPTTTKLATPPQGGSTRSSDRALPLQEEPEDDGAQDFTDQETEYEDPRRSSPTPSSDVYSDGHGSRYDGRRDIGQSTQHTDDDDDETLNEEVQDQLQQGKSESDDSGFTPRSPSTTLPERPRDERYSPTSNGQYSSTTVQYQVSAENQKTVRARHRNGSTDQLGMRTFDATLFERTNGQDQPVNGQRQTQPQATSQTHPQFPQPHPLRQFMPLDRSYNISQQSQSLPPMSPHFEDLKGVFDNPTSSYLQSFLQSPAPSPAGSGSRPNAPIPPTPLSHTAAPSPSPLSAMPSDIEPRQIGSPYPYPFTHIRRTTLSATQNAPSSTYDPNSPAAVREQLAMQMHMYALNNGLAPPSDTTFSPSATPFPTAGYNPWAFLYQAARPGDSNMSMRSSPSHEPVALPLPPLRGRGLRRKDNAPNLRGPVGRRRVKPPPRVESTQPRETSPEPSSGEETAGEDQFVERYAPNGQNGVWTNGDGQKVKATTGDGVDDAEDNEDEWYDEDDDEDDLLHLEYHPSYIVRSNKRRRRWDSRMEALTQAVCNLLDDSLDIKSLTPCSHSSKLSTERRIQLLSYSLPLPTLTISMP